MFENDIVIKDEEQSNINYSGQTIQEVLNLDKEQELNTQSVDHYEVDLDLYDDMYNSSPVIQDTVENGMKVLGVYDKLNKDLFLSLYKYKAEIVKESTMQKSTLINNKLMKDIVKNPDFIDLRKKCKMDEFSSLIGTEALNENTIDKITEWKEEIKKRLEERNIDSSALDSLQQLSEQEDSLIKAKDNLETVKDMIDSLGDTKQLDQLQQMYQDQIDSLSEQVTKGGQAIDELLAKAPEVITTLQDKYQQIIEETNDYMTDVVSDLEQWGFDNGTQIRVSFQEKRRAVERIRRSEKLKKLTNMIGKFRNTALKVQKRKSNSVKNSIKSVTTGGDLQRSLPSEKMQLCNPITKKNFLRKWNQNQLMQYKMISNSEKARGPIVCCIDTSGSMNGARETWSKAVAIAMLEIAHSQHRDFACILFDNNAQEPIIIAKDKLEPEKVVDIAEIFTYGGTNFEKPLKKAMEVIENQKFKKADILFITDGECNVNDSFLRKFNAVKDEKDFSVMSVLINTGRGSVSYGSLNKFSDKVILLSDLKDLKDDKSNLMKDIFSI